MAYISSQSNPTFVNHAGAYNVPDGVPVNQPSGFENLDLFSLPIERFSFLSFGVLEASPTRYTGTHQTNIDFFKTPNKATNTVIFQGIDFKYGANGGPIDGIVNSITVNVEGNATVSISGISIPVAKITDWSWRLDEQRKSEYFGTIFAGNDVIVGSNKDDRFSSGAGNDLFVGNLGNDIFDGGLGSDTFSTAALRHQTTFSNPIASTILFGPEGNDFLSSVEAIRLADGTAYFGADSFGAGVHRLYLATLGRAPDAPGLGAWTAALEAGAMSMDAVSAGFVNSAEFSLRYGAPGTEGFVALLYQNVLGRAPDAAGFSHWAGQIDGGGLTRQGAVLGFSEAAEFKMKTAPALADGLWAPDPAAVDVVRVYAATLDRLPDAGGLHGWIAARKAGMPAEQVETAFIGSAEFGQKYGALGNAQFVDQLYRNVFDRGADPTGMAHWGGGLDAGRLSRADVVHGLAFSDEMTAKIAPFVSDGVVFA